MGGGGGGSPTPTQNTSYTSNLPEYARPYFENIMDRTKAESEREYTPYQGQRIAEFSGDQQQAFGVTRDLAARGAPDLNTSRGVAGAATQAALRNTSFQPGSFSSDYQGRDFNVDYQPQNFQSNYQTSSYQGAPIRAQGVSSRDISTQNFNPQSADQYMSPYMQSVVDRQKAGAVRDFAEGQGARNQNAIASGAFGGYRNAIAQGVAQRGLNNQLADIQAQGLQSAYDRGSQQFNVDAGRRLQADSVNAGSNLTAQQANQQASLQAQSASEASRQFGATFGDQSRRFGSQANMESQKLNDEARRFRAQMGLQADQYGDQSAYRAAEMGLRADQMTEEARQRAAGIQQSGAALGLQGAEAFRQLGTTDQALTLERAKALGQVGDRYQEQQQRGLDTAYDNFVNQRDFDRNQLLFYSNIMRGVPTSPQQEVRQYSNPNPVSQLAGLGLAGAGAYRLATG